VWSAIGVKS